MEILRDLKRLNRLLVRLHLLEILLRCPWFWNRKVIFRKNGIILLANFLFIFDWFHQNPILKLILKSKLIISRIYFHRTILSGGHVLSSILKINVSSPEFNVLLLYNHDILRLEVVTQRCTLLYQRFLNRIWRRRMAHWLLLAKWALKHGTHLSGNRLVEISNPILIISIQILLNVNRPLTFVILCFVLSVMEV